MSSNVHNRLIFARISRKYLLYVHVYENVKKMDIENVTIQYRSKILGPKYTHKMHLHVKHAHVCIFDLA